MKNTIEKINDLEKNALEAEYSAKLARTGLEDARSTVKYAIMGGLDRNYGHVLAGTMSGDASVPWLLHGIAGALETWIDHLRGRSNFRGIEESEYAQIRGYHFGSLGWFLAWNLGGTTWPDRPWFFRDLDPVAFLRSCDLLTTPVEGEADTATPSPTALDVNDQRQNAEELTREARAARAAQLQAVAENVARIVAEPVKGGRWSYFLVLEDGNRIPVRTGGRRYQWATIHASAVLSASSENLIANLVKYSASSPNATIVGSAQPIRTFVITFSAQ